MKRYVSLGLILVVAALVGTGALRAAGVTLTLVPIGMDNPVGIDWLPRGPYANQLLVSEHYIDGLPFNFLRANPSTGAVAAWGTQSGWNNEIYFSTVRPGQGAGWQVGDVYSAQGDASGTGAAASIARFAADGSLLSANFATLMQTKNSGGNPLPVPILETKQKRGGVEFDRFSVAGNDLIVIASNDYFGGGGISGPSDVYRINAAGGVIHLAHVDVHLEGITTIPNDPAQYGPWAGQILSAAEFDNQLWTIDPNTGDTQHYGRNELGMPGGQTIKGEDMWVIPDNSTFYGLEFGEIAGVHRVWKADKVQWTGRVGQVLVAQEYYAQLYAIRWDTTLNGGIGGFVSDLINAGSPDGTTGPAHWEHITFVPDPAAIGDRVWNDLNANGVQDAGEPGIVSATVQLYTCDTNTLVGTTTTDSSGVYSFSGLAPDCYSVKFITPTGYVATPANVGNDASDSDAVGGSTGQYTLGAGETNLTVDAGFYKVASLGDFVWRDSNANGLQDAGEPGIAGATVQLFKCDNTLVSTTTTSGSGAYLFANLVPGCYYVKFTTPSGYVATTANVNANGNDATDSDAVSGKSGQYTLISGSSNLTVDAGFYQTAALGDYVWIDTNANGLQDAGEPAVAGATVQLYRCDNTLVGTTTTNTSGLYSFTNLVPGCYYVKFTAPSSYVLTTPNVGANDAIESDALAGGVTGNYTLVSGQTNNTVDAGLKRIGQFTTYTQGGWGAQPSGGNIASVMYAKFSTVYASSGGKLVVGGAKTVTLSSPTAVTAYLPDGTTPGQFTKNYTNPTSTSAGVFGSHVTTLKLNYDFSVAGFLPAGLGNLKIAPGNPLAGQTVAQVLTVLNAVVGGAAPPAGTTFSSLSNLAAAINANFDGGTQNNGVLIP